MALALMVVELMSVTETADPLFLPHAQLQHTQKSRTTVLFREHEQYKNLSATFDHFWQELLTPNGGFIRQEDQDHVTHLYGISMFHQLHCLAMIREAFQALQALSDPTPSPSRGPRRHEHGNSTSKENHWLHCFDYLGQVRSSAVSPLVS